MFTDNYDDDQIEEKHFRFTNMYIINMKRLTDILTVIKVNGILMI